ncbi:sensor histidine kinase [Leucobacter coleopterorum]|uniref:histidine kinase n=1 Tax=Leucobacter coleopterorum TaxID=2714933 RepID=A0ABX6JU82_9MICO|nr:histidine kinase [Leucobacter coleopterorum]QIM17846.1 sensor histidine kinase [Leucobacter coleopterorum]
MKVQLRQVPWVWVAVSAVAITLFAVSSTLGATVYSSPVAHSLGLSALQVAGIVLVNRYPRWGILTATVATTLMVALSSTIPPEAPWPIPVTSVIAMVVTLGIGTTRGRWLTATVAGAVVAIASTSVATDVGATMPPGPIVANITVFLSLAAAAVLGGVVLRTAILTRGELREAREVSEVALARREIVEERTRIAREMHDVVAHGMSVIQVQAASAPYRYPDIGIEVAAEFDELAATARTALAEMRALLGVLRADDDAEQAPQPGLAELPDLVAGARSTLLDSVLIDNLPEDVRQRMSPVMGLTIYRVVQESLSNIVRHAPGTEAEVEINYESAPGQSGRLLIGIRNSKPSEVTTHEIDTSGHGIRGMQERVAALGGALSTAPTADGGFAVLAIIPLNLEATTA